MFRVIFHLDMDAFYASIEQRDHPEWRGKPVVVGAPPTRRGVVCAASYEARKHGVRSAMPSVTAARLCPKAVFVNPDIEKYRRESELIMRIVEKTGAVIEQVSIDEAYLDVTAITRCGDLESSLFGSLDLARQLKSSIRDQRNLTSSIGIASNKLLAKIASDYGKPDGLMLIPDRDKVLFLRPMPVRVIHGIGQVTEQTLQKVGIKTVGDLQDYRGDLTSLVGSFGPVLKRFAMGEDHRQLDLNSERKSISSENTFLRDTDDRLILRKCLLEQAAEISAKLASAQCSAHTVQVKVRYGNFRTVTRQISVEEGIETEREIYRLACYLLGRERLVSAPLRLIGIGVSALSEHDRQLKLALQK
jgi:DNA polymerase IV